MPGTSTRDALKRRTSRERADLWKRVGAFVSKRREELGLSQGDIIRVLGYKSRNAVSNIEVGIEGLPAKHAYAWADVLELPRDAFFNFVTGQTDRLNVPKANAKPKDGDRLAARSSRVASSIGARRIPRSRRSRMK